MEMNKSSNRINAKGESWTCRWSFQLKVECIFFLFSDVVIPESPEAYIKLTENTLKSSSGRKRKAVVWQHENGGHAIN